MDPPVNFLHETDGLKRNPSILLALDSVHRSLLYKNLQYEHDDNGFQLVPRQNDVVLFEKRHLNNHQFTSSSSSSEVNMDHHQKYGEITEKIEQFHIESSNSDRKSDTSSQIVSIENCSPKKSPGKATITIKITTTPKKNRKIIEESENDKETEESSSGDQSCPSESLISSPGSIEGSFHDCREAHESTASFYEDTTEGTDSIQEGTYVIEDDDKPMINICQELTADMTVTSTVVINKAKIKQRNSLNSLHGERKMNLSRKSRQKIIDDNFCNEIFEQTQHFGKVHGLNQSNENAEEQQDSQTTLDSSFDEVENDRLVARPKCPNRKGGKLLAKRLKKLDEIRSSQSEFNSDSSTISFGPKKPPRTFASSKSKSDHSNSTVQMQPSCPTLDKIQCEDKKYGWDTSQIENHEIGWTVPKQFSNENIPSDIFGMLHYSKDELRVKNMRTSNSKAAPQEELGQKLDIDDVDGPCTPARNFDADEFRAFVENSKIRSTPRKPEHRRKSLTDFLNAERQPSFLDEGRPTNHDKIGICTNCKKGKIKKSFKKAAVKRTKSLFEASKKKIQLQRQKSREEKFETPQKENCDPNLDKKEFSGKKFHKHLGYTPDNLKCHSCKQSGSLVINTNSDNSSEIPIKPVRMSLNFKSKPDENMKNMKTLPNNPKEDTKLMKTLKNLKISPRKMFRNNKRMSEPISSQLTVQDSGGFQSYKNIIDDEITAIQRMGDFLNGMREIVEEDAPKKTEIKVEEPIYVEISPKNNKTIINEFISENNNRYLIVNNNPKAIYATVNKNRNSPIIKSRSLNNIDYLPGSSSPPQKIENQTKNHVARNLFKNNNERSLQEFDVIDILEDVRKIDENKLLKSSYKRCASPQNGSYDEAVTKNSIHFDRELFLLDALGASVVDRTSFNFADTDDEIESLQKYQCQEIDDIAHTLRDNIALSEVTTIDDTDIEDTGFDTVDFPMMRQIQENDLECSNDNTQSISESDLTSNVSPMTLSPMTGTPLTGSPQSGKFKNKTAGMYRTVKDKLRTSFRKTKKLLHYSNIFEEKPNNLLKPKFSFDLDEYRKRYENDKKVDEIVQSLSVSSSTMELNNEYLAELVCQIRMQCDIRKQLKQALGICRGTREFECSTELIEAERLLLISTMKETAARNELAQIDYDKAGCVKTSGKKVGSVRLNNFEFPLKEVAIYDQLFNYFYVVVSTYKNHVKATLAIERTKEGRVSFKNSEIKFVNLEADYEIKIEIFELRLRKNVRNYSHESKFHLNKVTEQKSFLACPSPPKIISPGKFLPTKSNSPKKTDFDNEFTRFKSQGFLKLTSFGLVPSKTNTTDSEMSIYSTANYFKQSIMECDDHSMHNLEDHKTFKFSSMIYNSNLLGSITFDIKSEVKFCSSKIEGFLTIGEIINGCKVWNRRWCKINGFIMNFWNYPQDSHEKPSVFYLDLKKCITDDIKPADRSICSRPKSFQIEIFDQSKNDRHNGTNIKSYLLSADSQTELNSWLNELNRIVKFVKEWTI